MNSSTPCSEQQEIQTNGWNIKAIGEGKVYILECSNVGTLHFDGKNILTKGLVGEQARGMQYGSYTTSAKVPAEGNLSETVTFPLEFGGTPVVIAEIYGGYANAIVSTKSISKSGFEATFTNLHTTARALKLNYIAFY